MLMEFMQTSMLEKKERTWLLEVEEVRHEPTLTSIVVVEVSFNLQPGTSHWFRWWYHASKGTVAQNKSWRVEIRVWCFNSKDARKVLTKSNCQTWSLIWKVAGRIRPKRTWIWIIKVEKEFLLHFFKRVACYSHKEE